MIPGELFIQDGEIELNKGRNTVTLSVSNTGDRPIQVGSHYHFFETNPALKFERKKARGMRLDIAAGTAVRFEPGQDSRRNACRGCREAHRLRLPERNHGKTLRRRHAGQNRANRLRRHVRPYDRRPRPARRYRSHHRGREGFYRLRRRGEIRRRQGDPRWHGAIANHQSPGCRRYRDHQCAHSGSLGNCEGGRWHQGR